MQSDPALTAAVNNLTRIVSKLTVALHYMNPDVKKYNRKVRIESDEELKDILRQVEAYKKKRAGES